jgi:hypothetical protein
LTTITGPQQQGRKTNQGKTQEGTSICAFHFKISFYDFGFLILDFGF